MFKRISTLLLTLIMTIGLSSCNSPNTSSNDTKPTTYVKSLDLAKGTTVNFYGFGGDESANKWVDNTLAKEVKEKYNITLKRVPMNPEDILNKLLGEKQGNTNGTIDLVWINGENFYSAKKASLLYGPFSASLPNYTKYLDSSSPDITKDFGYDTEGYESPYGKSQFVMIYNKNKVKNYPKNTNDLLKLCKDNPGMFTYPAPPDFTGSAFLRNIIYDIIGSDVVLSLPNNKEKVKTAIMPALKYLNNLKPYLWNKGTTYPSTLSQLDNMFADNQVFGTVSYNPNSIQSKKLLGQYPESAVSTIFEKGTIGNTHFVAIPFNSQNKNGAMVVANEILSPKMQSTKYQPNIWGDLPSIETSKLSNDEKKMFDLNMNSDSVSMETLLNNRLSEPAPYLIPIIEELWEEYVLKG